MLDAALAALFEIGQPARLGFLFLGMALGILFGVLPGLGGIAAVSIIIPFVLLLDDYAALAMLIGAISVIYTADTITSVLVGTPGSPASAPTAIEGYELAKQGRAGEALSLGFLSSVSGGLVGAVVLFLAIPIAGPLVLALGTPELLMLAALGLVLASNLLGGRRSIGLLCGGFGLLLGAVGAAPAATEFRFTFGQVYLWDGLSITVVALGLFGLPEIIELVASGGSISPSSHVSGGWRRGFSGWAKERGLVLRGSLIGALGGFIPAVGASASTWVAYSHAVSTSKDKSKFGKGEPRGIIASEAANNATAISDLVPTLLFGVPGGPTAAVFLAAFMTLGYIPGPRLLTDQPVILYTIVWSAALASILGGLLCFLLTPWIARLTRVPFYLIGAPLLMIIMIGALRTSGSIGDILVLFILGILGWLLKRVDWPRAPILVGFVLSGPIEQYFWLANRLHGWSWMARPGVIIIAALIFLPPVVQVGLKHFRKAKGPKTAPPSPNIAETKPAERARVPQISVALLGAFILCLLYATWEVFQMEADARLLPLCALFLSLPAAMFAFLSDIYDIRHRGWALNDATGERRNELKLWLVFAGVFPATIWLGFLSAMFLFLTFMMLRWSQVRLIPALLFAGAIVTVGSWTMGLMYLRPPDGPMDEYFRSTFTAITQFVQAKI